MKRGRRTKRRTSRHRVQARPTPDATGSSTRAGVVHERHWSRELRYGAAWSALVLELLFVTDAGMGGLSPVRAALWTGLSTLLLVVLVPARVSAGEGGIAAHGILSRTSVRTDRLVAAEWADGVSSRVLLCDDAGGRVDIAARVLTGNPLLWRTVEEGVRHSCARGTLRTGNDDLRRLARCIDTDTARGVLQASGLG